MLEALVSLKGDAAPPVGRDRIRLLEAVAREGSITAGAKAVGLTYKAAWDALDAMANLFGKPLLATRTGGRGGGGTGLTATGLKVVQAFGRLEAEMTRVMRLLEPELAGTGVSPLTLMSSGFLMRTSARNVLRGTVTAILSDALMADIAVQVSDQTTIHGVVTTESVGSLGLCIGREVIVLIKAPFVVMATGAEAPQVSVRNCVPGTVTRCELSSVNAEVVLDIGGGKTLAATLTAHSAKSLALEPGCSAFALFDAAHVIIAID